MAAGGAYVFPAPSAGRCRLAAALVLAVAMTVDKAINYGAARVYRARQESVCTDAHVCTGKAARVYRARQESVAWLRRVALLAIRRLGSRMRSIMGMPWGCSRKKSSHYLLRYRSHIISLFIAISIALVIRITTPV